MSIACMPFIRGVCAAYSDIADLTRLCTPITNAELKDRARLEDRSLGYDVGDEP